MPPPRRRDDRRDPFLSGMDLPDDVLDAEVLDADVLDAEVLDADVLDAEVLDADILDGEILDASVVTAEPVGVGDRESSNLLELDDGPPAVFDLDAIDGPLVAGTTPAPSLPVYESLPAAPTGADMLSLDIDPPAPTRTATRAATANRPAVRITFVCPGERSPFDGRG